MLKDVQAQKDLRHIPLKHVGIKDLRWPIQLKDPKNGVQHSVATVKLAVDLPHEQRGTHMSRFVECLKLMGPVHPHGLEAMLDTLKEKLGAQKALIELDFPYFIEKQAPVSGQTSFLDVSCHYRAEKGEKFLLDVGVDVPIHTLCPCSKEISRYGAHNQRAWARMVIRSTKPVWIEELVDVAAMKAAGAVAFSEDGKSVMNTALFRDGLMKIAEVDGVVMSHCEDRDLVAGGVMNAGPKQMELGYPGITNAVEDVIAARDIFMAAEQGVQLHLCHCSTKGTVELMRMAKRQPTALIRLLRSFPSRRAGC